MNIASVPCRCGHSWMVPGTGPAQSGTWASSPTASSSDGVATALVDRGDHGRGLGEHRRAGGVEQHAAGPDQVERRVDQLPLEHHQREQVVGLARPPGLRAAPQRAETGARRVDEDPVEAAGAVRRPGAVGGDDAGDAGGTVAAARGHQARCGAAARSLATSSAPRSAARPASSADLPPGPAHRSSQRRVGALERGVGQRHRDQLRALVLDAGTALGHGRHRHRGRRRPGRRRTASTGSAPPAARRGSTRPGRATRVTAGARCRRRAAACSSSLPTARAQLVDHPLRVAVGDRRCRVGWVRASGCDLRDPLVEVVLGHRPQHRVGEARRRRSWTAGATRSTVVLIAACAGTRIDSSWWAPSRSRVEDPGLDLGQRPVGAGGDDRVVRAAHPDRARRQLGGERRVAARSSL